MTEPMHDLQMARTHAAIQIDTALDFQGAWDKFTLAIWREGLAAIAQTLAIDETRQVTAGLITLLIIRARPQDDTDAATPAYLVNLTSEKAVAAAVIQSSTDNDILYHYYAKGIDGPTFNDIVDQLTPRWPLLRAQLQKDFTHG